MTFAGFMAYYAHYLEPFRDELSSPLKHEIDEGADPRVLLLAGYSYGAFVTASLPPITSILGHFQNPEKGSAAADVCLRAQHLAEKQNAALASARAAVISQPKSPRKSGSAGLDMMVRVGGDEDGAHRNSHDARRSMSAEADKIRREVGEFMERVKRSGSRSRQRHDRHPVDVTNRMSTHDGPTDHLEQAVSTSSAIAQDDLPLPRVAYLLVSPPQGTVKTLLGIFSQNPFARKPKEMASQTALAATAAATQNSSPATSPDETLTRNPTLVVYGSEDGFIAAKTQRQWVSRLSAAPGSLFRAHEVSRAGHFWVEEGALGILENAVKSFGEQLLVGTAWDKVAR
jgi:hypothetical protein